MEFLVLFGLTDHGLDPLREIHIFPWNKSAEWHTGDFPGMDLGRGGTRHLHAA